MTTHINIERLKPSTVIHRSDDYDFGPFGSFAAVQDIEFDGFGYTVTARMIHSDHGYVTDREVQFILDAGDTVQFGGLGELVLRDEDDVSAEEWQAKSDATDAACLKLQGALNDLQGHTCRPIDERLLEASVAAAIGVPALEAAE